jgi:hypothetical protein
MKPIGNNTGEWGLPGSLVPPFVFADSVPAQFEFQRVPGHPATTSSVLFLVMAQIPSCP